MTKGTKALHATGKRGRRGSGRSGRGPILEARDTGDRGRGLRFCLAQTAGLLDLGSSLSLLAALSFAVSLCQLCTPKTRAFFLRVCENKSSESGDS